MWRKSARICHPDKGGDTAVFQRLQEAFEKVGEIIKELNKNEPTDEGDEEELFSIKVFNEFNFKKENTNSFTIYVENERTNDWNSVIYMETQRYQTRARVMEDIGAMMTIIQME